MKAAIAIASKIHILNRFDLERTQKAITKIDEQKATLLRCESDEMLLIERYETANS